jgi:hypothetical protein
MLHQANHYDPLTGIGSISEGACSSSCFPVRHVAACKVSADQKSCVRNPQNPTLTISTDHSEGLSQNSLPSLTACAIIALDVQLHHHSNYRRQSCSAQDTHRPNLSLEATARLL